MQIAFKKVACIAMALVMLLTFAPLNIFTLETNNVEAVSLLDSNNVASRCEIEVPSQSTGFAKELMVDTSPDTAMNTMWKADDTTGVGVIKLKLPAGIDSKTISNIQIAFSGEAGATADVQLQKVVNSVVGDPILIRNFTTQAMDGVLDYNYNASAGGISHIYIAVSNPSKAFALSIKDIKITLTESIESGENIASKAVVTTFDNTLTAAEIHKITDNSNNSGPTHTRDIALDDWVNLDMTIDVNVNAIELVFQNKGATDDTNRFIEYQLVGRNSTAANYSVLGSGIAQMTQSTNVTRHFLGELKLRDIKVVVTNTGGTPAKTFINEFKVFSSIGMNIANLGSATLRKNATATDVNASALIDNNYSSGTDLGATITAGAFAVVSLDKTYGVTAVEFTAEISTVNTNAKYDYSVYGQKEFSTQWTKIGSDTLQCNTEFRTRLLLLDEATKYKNIKIVVDRFYDNARYTPWIPFYEIKVFSFVEAQVDDTNLAWGKPVTVAANRSTANYVNDGNTSTSWSDTDVPGYIDIDLEKNYNINEVEIYLPSAGYQQYTIYTSLDGRDFAKFSEKTDKSSCPATGISHSATTPTVARVIRVAMEYNNRANRATVNEIRILGTPNTAVPLKPRVPLGQGNFGGVEYKFADSPQNTTFTNANTIDEVKGIVSRIIGADYVSWFNFEVAPNTTNAAWDYFEISDDAGKIKIKGNDGVALATGLNHYLKTFCFVNIGQTIVQGRMPLTPARVGTPIRKDTKFKIRYSYNYCTMSYTMAFWGEKEWRREIDWLALNGVNTPLDTTGQEEVWRRFLISVGYTDQQARDYISGPAFYAWAYMANMSRWGGPLHDTWFTERTDLARKNRLAMHKLGMQPILQGWCGMLPNDINQIDPDIPVVSQGGWAGGFPRPPLARPDTEKFKTYAQLFYKAQKEVLGDGEFYATDPYHEGGSPGPVNKTAAFKIIAEEMNKADPGCTWVVQSWQGSPGSNGIEGIRQSGIKSFILDLNAETKLQKNWFERERQPWVLCLLNNFGGREGLYGRLDNILNNLKTAYDGSTYLKGIGITPEATWDNPIMYDIFLTSVWLDDPTAAFPAINVDDWLKDYVKRRYGEFSESAYQSWLIYTDTVYKTSMIDKGQGAPESIINARPKWDINVASTWGNCVIQYQKPDLERALKLLFADYDKLKSSPGYMYDLVDLIKQVLSNTAQEMLAEMKSLYNSATASNTTAFEAKMNSFLSLIDQVELATSTQKSMMLGNYITMAKNMAKNADDFTRELYKINAKALYTTWSPRVSDLNDYSNRQWSGLTGDFYKVRWETWLQNKLDEKKGTTPRTQVKSGFEWEWDWVRNDTVYPSEPVLTVDIKTVAQKVINDFTISKNHNKNTYRGLIAHASNIVKDTVNGSYSTASWNAFTTARTAANAKITYGKNSGGMFVENTNPIANITVDDITALQNAIDGLTLAGTTLAAPTNVRWSSTGVISYDTVANASSYNVQLYMDDVPQGAAVNTTALTVDFNTAIKKTAAYTVKVVAVGNNTTYMDSPQSAASTVYNFTATTTALTVIDGLGWHTSTKTIATWVKNPNASSYLIQLYKNNVKLGDAADVAKEFNEYNFEYLITTNAPGSFTFEITAIGDKIAYTNSPVSAKSPAYVATIIAPQLDKATNLRWGYNTTNPYEASFNAVPLATGYDVSLYRGETFITKQTTANNVTKYDFKSAIRTGGVGEYQFEVVAKADGIINNDSVGSKSNALNYAGAANATGANTAYTKTDDAYPSTPINVNLDTNGASDWLVCKSGNGSADTPKPNVTGRRITRTSSIATNTTATDSRYSLNSTLGSITNYRTVEVYDNPCETTFTVPIVTGKQTVKLFTGGWKSNYTLNAYIDGELITPQTTINNADASHMYTHTYDITSATDSTLYILVSSSGTDRHLFFSAVTLDALSDVKIACVGDSITYGEGGAGTAAQRIDQAKSYPTKLQTALNAMANDGTFAGKQFVVRNFGAIGAALLPKATTNTISYMTGTAVPKGSTISYKTVYENSLAYKPDVVYIMMGTNNTPIDTTKDNFKTALNELIDSYKTANPNVKVFLMTPPTMNLYPSASTWFKPTILTNNIIPAIKEVVTANPTYTLVDINDKSKDWTLTEISEKNDRNESDKIHPNDAGYTAMTGFVKESFTAYYTASLPKMPSVTAPKWTGFIASWTGVKDANNYTVSLYKNNVLVADSTQTILTQSALEFNYRSLITTNGTGNYTFKVIANSAMTGQLQGSTPTTSTDLVYKIQLATPQGLTWSTHTASWTAVPNAASYNVQLYKDFVPVGTVFNTTTLSKDFNSDIIRESGAYTFSVIAVANPTLNADSRSNISSAVRYTAALPTLTTPTGLTFINGTASWGAVTNATGYEIQLYKDNTAKGDAVTLTTTTYNFTSIITELGSYTFTVKATGNAATHLNSAVSIKSAAYAYTPAKLANTDGVAGITISDALTALKISTNVINDATKYRYSKQDVQDIMNYVLFNTPLNDTFIK